LVVVVELDDPELPDDPEPPEKPPPLEPPLPPPPWTSAKMQEAGPVTFTVADDDDWSTVPLALLALPIE